jgi:hypothetical protein
MYQPYFVNMKDYKSDGFGKAKIVSYGGIGASLAIIFQTAPIWLPVLGLVLSSLSTLSVCIIAFISPLINKAIKI